MPREAWGSRRVHSSRRPAAHTSSPRASPRSWPPSARRPPGTFGTQEHSSPPVSSLSPAAMLGPLHSVSSSPAGPSLHVCSWPCPPLSPPARSEPSSSCYPPGRGNVSPLFPPRQPGFPSPLRAAPPSPWPLEGPRPPVPPAAAVTTGRAHPGPPTALRRRVRPPRPSRPPQTRAPCPLVKNVFRNAVWFPRGFLTRASLTSVFLTSLTESAPRAGTAGDGGGAATSRC